MTAWQNSPTTDATEAETVAIVTKKYGDKTGKAFKAWYDAARKTDPNITPQQAAVVFLAGYVVSRGVAKTANVVTGGTAKVSSGGQNLGTFSGDGVPQAAAKGAENVVKGPLSGLAAIGAFFNALGDPNTWIRVTKVVVGGVLLIVGLVHITGADNAVASVARKVPLPV